MSKLLLVRLSSMGDLIHTLPAVTDLARYRPDIELHWLCETAFADIARLHPFVKKVQIMSWRNWRKRLWQPSTWQQMRALFDELQRQQYYQVLDSQGLLKSAFFARKAKASILTGLDKKSAREPFSAYFYQQKIFVPKTENAVWRNRDLFAKTFGYTLEGKPDFGVSISMDNDWVLDEPYCVALHATSRDSKLWPIEHWLALFTQLHHFYQLPIWLPWGNQQEYERAKQMAEKLPFVHICPKLTLFQAACLLQKAQLVVGVDTGLLHLANALDCALVGIYTDSDPVKTGVQLSLWAMNLGNIGQVPSVDEVFAAAKQVLENKAIDTQAR